MSDMISEYGWVLWVAFFLGLLILGFMMTQKSLKGSKKSRQGTLEEDTKKSPGGGEDIPRGGFRAGSRPWWKRPLASVAAFLMIVWMVYAGFGIYNRLQAANQREFNGKYITRLGLQHNGPSTSVWGEAVYTKDKRMIHPGVDAQTVYLPNLPDPRTASVSIVPEDASRVDTIVYRLGFYNDDGSGNLASQKLQYWPTSRGCLKINPRGRTIQLGALRQDTVSGGANFIIRLGPPVSS